MKRLGMMLTTSVVMTCVGVLSAQGVSFGMPGAVKNKARELKAKRESMPEGIRISSLGTRSTSAGKGSRVRFACAVTGAAGEISYTWTADAGTFLWAGGSSATWVAPQATGTYTISCRVSEAGGKSDQRSTTIPVRDPGTVKWTYAGNVRGCPAIAEDGTIYFCDTGGALHSVNPDGTANWVHPGAGAGPVIGEDGMIYTAGGSNVYAFTSAGLAWTVEVGFVSAIPIIDDVRRTLYLDNAAAIDLDNRTMKWSVAGTILPTTIGPDGTVYGTFTTNHINYLRAINPDGSMKWNRPVTDYVGVEYFAASTMSVYFIHAQPSYPGWTRRINAIDGTVSWENSAVSACVPVIDSERYIYGGYSTIAIADMETGSTVLTATGVVVAAKSYLLGSDSTLYCTEYDKFTAIALSPVRVLWSVSMTMRGIASNTKYPTIAQDGTVYIANGDGVLYAIQATGYLSEDAIWPKWRRDLRNTGCATAR